MLSTRLVLVFGMKPEPPGIMCVTECHHAAIKMMAQVFPKGINPNDCEHAHLQSPSEQINALFVRHLESHCQAVMICGPVISIFGMLALGLRDGDFHAHFE